MELNKIDITNFSTREKRMYASLLQAKAPLSTTEKEMLKELNKLNDELTDKEKEMLQALKDLRSAILDSGKLNPDSVWMNCLEIKIMKFEG